jgi:hypothetical protein
LQNDLKDFIFIYLRQNNLRNLIVDFIAAFTFDILINDCTSIEKYSRIILNLKQLSTINLDKYFQSKKFQNIFQKKKDF